MGRPKIKQWLKGPATLWWYFLSNDIYHDNGFWKHDIQMFIDSVMCWTRPKRCSEPGAEPAWPAVLLKVGLTDAPESRLPRAKHSHPYRTHVKTKVHPFPQERPGCAVPEGRALWLALLLFFFKFTSSVSFLAHFSVVWWVSGKGYKASYPVPTTTPSSHFQSWCTLANSNLLPCTHLSEIIHRTSQRPDPNPSKISDYHFYFFWSCAKDWGKSKSECSNKIKWVPWSEAMLALGGETRSSGKPRLLWQEFLGSHLSQGCEMSGRTGWHGTKAAQGL